jgi:hypothetical protein
MYSKRWSRPLTAAVHLIRWTLVICYDLLEFESKRLYFSHVPVVILKTFPLGAVFFPISFKTLQFGVIEPVSCNSLRNTFNLLCLASCNKPRKFPTGLVWKLQMAVFQLVPFPIGTNDFPNRSHKQTCF